jgi:hypothetical protein
MASPGIAIGHAAMADVTDPARADLIEPIRIVGH